MKKKEKLTKKKLDKINERINKGEDTDKDIELLTDYFIDFMETLEK